MIKMEMASSDGGSINRTNLIVNYLPQSISDEEFRTMFSSIGPIQGSKIVRDRTTGYSYGFGFVNFQKEEDAQRAITSLNGMQIQNKTIKVALSREGRDVKNANLYVRNIPRNYKKEELEAAFAQFGTIVQCRVLMDHNTGYSKCVGFVLFDNKEEADTAIQTMDGQTLPGGTEPLSVRHAEENRSKTRPLVVVGGRGGGAGGPGFNQYGPAGFGGGGFQGGYGPMRGRGGPHQRFNPMLGPYGNGNGIGDGPGCHTLFVYNIGTDADERTLWQLFSPFGAVQKVNVIKDYQKNQCKGYGFVSMPNYNEAVTAIQNLNGYRYGGKPLQVSFKTPK